MRADVLAVAGAPAVGTSLGFSPPWLAAVGGRSVSHPVGDVWPVEENLHHVRCSEAPHIQNLQSWVISKYAVTNLLRSVRFRHVKDYSERGVGRSWHVGCQFVRRSPTMSWLSATYWVARFSHGVLTTMKLALLLMRTWFWPLASIPAWVCTASASAVTGIVARASPPRGRITTLMSVGGSGSSGATRLGASS